MPGKKYVKAIFLVVCGWEGNGLFLDSSLGLCVFCAFPQ